MDEENRTRCPTLELGRERSITISLSLVEALALSERLRGRDGDLIVGVRERLEGELFRAA